VFPQTQKESEALEPRLLERRGPPLLRAGKLAGTVRQVQRTGRLQKGKKVCLQEKKKKDRVEVFGGKALSSANLKGKRTSCCGGGGGAV